jgi:hypothetical protein
MLQERRLRVIHWCDQNNKDDSKWLPLRQAMWARLEEDDYMFRNGLVTNHTDFP